MQNVPPFLKDISFLKVFKSLIFRRKVWRLWHEKESHSAYRLGKDSETIREIKESPRLIIVLHYTASIERCRYREYQYWVLAIATSDNTMTSQRHNLPPTMEILTHSFPKFPKISNIFLNFLKFPKKVQNLQPFPENFHNSGYIT